MNSSLNKITTYYIYKITNKINNKIYVGKTTKSIERRFAEHVMVSNKEKDTSVKLHNAIRKYGIDNFMIEELDVATTKEELNKKERFWIDKLSARNPDIGYNICKGGEGGSGGAHFAGHKHTEETRKQMSKNRCGKNNANFGNRWKRTEDMKYPSIFGENNPMFGKHQTEAAKEKSRQKHLGKKAYSNIKLDKVIMLTPEDGKALIAADSDWFEGNIHRIKKNK